MEVNLNEAKYFRLFYDTADDEQENMYFITNAPIKEIEKVVRKHKADEFSTFQTVKKEIKDKKYFIQEIDMLEFDFNYARKKE